MDNPFYQMAMQGIMSGVGGSAFQSGGGGNMGGQNNMGGGGFGGGQFGGTSGPDGMGIALRSLCRVLDTAKVAYHLRDFDDLLAARGL
jgi:hypothetical protein